MPLFNAALFALPRVLPSFVRQYSGVVVDASSSSELVAYDPVSNRPWQLFAAVLLERPPIVGQTLTTLETDFQTLLDDAEHERSLKSDHELRVHRDAENAERKRRGLDVLDESLQTGLEYEEDREKVLASFTPATRVTEVDLGSLNNRLDKKLYLHVRHALDPASWFLPFGAIDSNGRRSLRDIAEEAILDACSGGDVGARNRVLSEVQFLGHTPAAFYKYIYPRKSEASLHFRGAKFYVLKAFLKNPRTFEMGQKGKVAWMTKKDMRTLISREYSAKIGSCLFD